MIRMPAAAAVGAPLTASHSSRSLTASELGSTVQLLRPTPDMRDARRIRRRDQAGSDLAAEQGDPQPGAQEVSPAS